MDIYCEIKKREGRSWWGRGGGEIKGKQKENKRKEKKGVCVCVCVAVRSKRTRRKVQVKPSRPTLTHLSTLTPFSYVS